MSKILLRTDGRMAFYAQTKDTETIRGYKPRTRIRSAIGWALCFAGKNACTSTLTIHKKFTGHRKFLMDMVFQMAQVKPVQIEGLLPEFNEEFEIMSANTLDPQPLLGKQLQGIILRYKEYMPEGLKLFINNEGVWITGEEWLNEEQTRQMVKLCEALVLGLKQEKIK